MFKFSKLFWQIPLYFFAWIGTPWRTSSNELSTRYGHYFIRFFLLCVFLFVFFPLFIWANIKSHWYVLIGAFLLILFFDTVIWICRLAYIYVIAEEENKKFSEEMSKKENWKDDVNPYSTCGDTTYYRHKMWDNNHPKQLKHKDVNSEDDDEI